MQYQVADFCHNDRDALRHSIEQTIRDGGDDPEDFRSDIERAIANAEESDAD